MPRYQVGSVRKIKRAEGLTWVLRYYATRSDGKRVEPRTFGQLCQDYIENELRIDQAESARPKAFPTIETYERHLITRIIPRWGRLAPLAVESRDVEAWFRELRT